MDNLAAPLSDVFVHGPGLDEQWYSVIPLVWTLSKLDDYYERFKAHRILSDDVPQGRDGFEMFVLNSGGLWFEMLDADGNVVGVIYLTDFVSSLEGDRYNSAAFHMSMWDQKVSPRMPVLVDFVREVFRRFKLHRLEMEIPLFAGGAIRLAKRAGFVDEGVRRAARRYNGEWFGVLHLAMLENEVP